MCDGLIHCDSFTPADELDSDLDGYVTCDPTTGPGWQGATIIGGNDCDDTDATLSLAPTWYLDFDGDGFGNSTFQWLTVWLQQVGMSLMMTTA